MHDIGQLSLVDPIPGGATAMVAPADQRRIAELGAEVIRQTGVLDRVADDRRAAGRPVPPRRRDCDPDLPLASRIIKAVNAYDDLVGGLARVRAQASRRWSGCGCRMAYDYDPRVVDVLSRIVERQAAYAY